MITQEQLEKYKKIYKDYYKKDIPNEEAMDQAISLLRLVELIYKPMTVEDYEKLQERRRETGDIK